jgi:hypothetical protein
MNQALRVLTHDCLFGRTRGPDGEGVARGLLISVVAVNCEVIDVLVVLDDLGGDVVSNSSSVGVGVEQVLLGPTLRGRRGRCARERHASAAAVGNEIRCGWDAREARTVGSETGSVVTDIGRRRRGAISVVTGGG